MWYRVIFLHLKEIEMTRKEAIAARLKFYSTDKPCKYGHQAPRLTIDGSCCECRKVNQRIERANTRALLNNSAQVEDNAKKAINWQ